jgi:hypothetical protein
LAHAGRPDSSGRAQLLICLFLPPLQRNAAIVGEVPAVRGRLFYKDPTLTRRFDQETPAMMVFGQLGLWMVERQADEKA